MGPRRREMPAGADERAFRVTQCGANRALCRSIGGAARWHS